MSELKASPLPFGAQLMGRYEVRGFLGRGGHAHVYEGYDAFVDRAVAIKVIGPSANGGHELALRAQSEARVLARVQHPNIVQMYEAGVTQDGLVYLVMEKLEGRTLLEVSRDPGNLRPREALEIAIQIADALLAAHIQGVLHRDLKPANVFITRNNRVKVLDFGVAKIKGYGVHSTRRDVVQGTMIYMSPEQLQGLSLTARSDIFSLGTMLYELLYRHPVLLGENIPSFSEVGWLQIATLPPLLDTLDAGIPRHVARFVHRCIQKRPEDRFESMLQVGESARTALERLLSEGGAAACAARELSLPGRGSLEQQGLLRASQRLTVRPFLSTDEAEVLSAAASVTRTSTRAAGAARPWRALERLDAAPGQTLRIMGGPAPLAMAVEPAQATLPTRTASPRWVPPQASNTETSVRASLSRARAGLAAKLGLSRKPFGWRAVGYGFALVGLAFFGYWHAAGRAQGKRPAVEEVLVKSVVTKPLTGSNAALPVSTPLAVEEHQPAVLPVAEGQADTTRPSAPAPEAAVEKKPMRRTKGGSNKPAEEAKASAASLFDLPFASPEDDEPDYAPEVRSARSSGPAKRLMADPVDEVYGPAQAARGPSSGARRTSAALRGDP